jgi:hypothetical protein
MDSGAEGEIVSINHLRDSSIVRLAKDKLGLSLVCYAIGELTAVDPTLPEPPG